MWDRTTRHLADHWRPAALLAFATIGVNDALSAILQSALPTAAPAMRVAGVVLLLVGALWSILGQIGITMLALDRTATARGAFVAALPRLGAMIGATLLIALAGTLGALPLVGAIVMGAADLQAQPPVVPPWIGVYMLVFLIVALCVWARLILITPLVAVGMGPVAAIRASVVSTRGCFWRIFGTLLLYLLVSGVASLAMGSALGLVFRLLVPGLAWLLAPAFTAIASALISMTALIFIAKLHEALDRRPGAWERSA
ncbi:hypothetical protein NX02_05925 [Sphingomonas sanxanigenens DSM 19645 = NX02]|uniref:Glycerophosphoryl diester phosphodiesterase membrane domain-containing protein n=1 Tax=Sphingomonas sanxanigenens DSM 19645 = NX02 TaxID=1123269 RepID=W0AB75_9SPHN|nr:hypothetical protein NX02_05925 [Sphingomonas sanxanigenens DSM 19645 = NX02]